LDPEDGAVDETGAPVTLSRNVYPNYDIILAITDYSLTAPLTAQAKIHGFRGATLHGLNDIILNSGLSVDYNFVSKQAEVFRQVITFTDHFDINFKALDRSFKLTLRCDKQDAQKSHGLCPAGKPDVANLPAGEVYFVPNGAEGSFPFRYSDGTIAEMIVEDGAIIKSNLISGDQDIVDARNTQLKEDPATGILGELGFGTQLLPVSGKDIQDEKIFGTCHVATGRSDHLGGNLTPELFNSKMNASHDDILYAPHKTPEISVSSVVMHKNGETQEIFSDYFPSPWLLDNVSTVYPAEKFLVSA
jgi:leucyl aminopeptidase (aminopeptidase T)